jgi:hypothetical protein
MRIEFAVLELRRLIFESESNLAVSRPSTSMCLFSQAPSACQSENRCKVGANLIPINSPTECTTESQYSGTTVSLACLSIIGGSTNKPPLYIASCPMSGSADSGHTITTILRKACSTYGNITLFKVYYGLPNHNGLCTRPSPEVCSEVEAAGVIPVDRPKSGLGALATDAFCFWADNLGSPGTTIVFVSGNSDLVYMVSALRARNANVGLIVPPDQPTKALTTHGSWVLRWEQLQAHDTIALLVHDVKTSDGIRGGPSDSAPLVPKNVATSATNLESSGGFGLANGTSPARNAGVAQTRVGVNIREPPPVAQPQPEQTVAQPPQATIAYEVTSQKIPQPLPLVNSSPTRWQWKPTGIHALQMFETDPLFAQLLKDPEAIKVKTWRRQLKQNFYLAPADGNVRVDSRFVASALVA